MELRNDYRWIVVMLSLSLIMLICKLTGIINISWIWVLFPLWYPIVALGVVVLFLFIFIIIGAILQQKKEDKS